MITLLRDYKIVTWKNGLIAEEIIKRRHPSSASSISSALYRNILNLRDGAKALPPPLSFHVQLEACSMSSVRRRGAGWGLSNVVVTTACVADLLEENRISNEGWNEVTEEGMGHWNSHSLDEIQKRKLLLHDCILVQYRSFTARGAGAASGRRGRDGAVGDPAGGKERRRLKGLLNDKRCARAARGEYRS
ncbi:hypothetical protein EVAR_79190_1 [Eumeta japonica]|uniref:Uncharacterized protein n=1 Tax=Eumeta variegata TaxID=151549 RepID=A0A4C1UT50_EUMVA|nr:hypothetical protein EVAR_79190_1 [Eumeta japonica]